MHKVIYLKLYIFFLFTIKLILRISATNYFLYKNITIKSRPRYIYYKSWSFGQHRAYGVSHLSGIEETNDEEKVGILSGKRGRSRRGRKKRGRHRGNHMTFMR